MTERTYDEDVRGYLDTALRKIESGTVTEHDREWAGLVRQRLDLSDGRVRDPEWAEKIIVGPAASEPPGRAEADGADEV